MVSQFPPGSQWQFDGFWPAAPHRDNGRAGVLTACPMQPYGAGGPFFGCAYAEKDMPTPAVETATPKLDKDGEAARERLLHQVTTHGTEDSPMEPTTLIDDYLAGPQLLRKTMAGMPPEQLLARPIPGKWSTLEVVCHLADFEIVFADRIKRVVAENEPTMFGGDPDLFAARLAYHLRNPEEELLLIALVRQQVAGFFAP